MNLGGTLPPPDYALCYRGFGEDVDATDCLAVKQYMPLWLSAESYN